jgi:hypothetical protein
MRRYIIAAEWEHPFEDETVTCRFVIDTVENVLVESNIRRGRRWNRATRAQHEDLEDSVIHSQVDDIYDRYKDCGMTSSATIPDWAVGPHERARRQAERQQNLLLRRTRTPSVPKQLSFEYSGTSPNVAMVKACPTR